MTAESTMVRIEMFGGEEDPDSKTEIYSRNPEPILVYVDHIDGSNGSVEFAVRIDPYASKPTVEIFDGNGKVHQRIYIEGDLDITFDSSINTCNCHN